MISQADVVGLPECGIELWPLELVEGLLKGFCRLGGAFGTSSIFDKVSLFLLSISSSCRCNSAM
jgi:hypothetical protein